jgi:hypothetical protein
MGEAAKEGSEAVEERSEAVKKAADGKTATDERYSLAELLASDSSVRSLLIATISQDVIRAIEERSARRKASSMTWFSICAAIIVAISGFLVNELLSIRAEKAVEAATGKSLLGLTFSTDVAALNFETLNLNQRPGFSQDEAETLINKISLLYSTHVDGPNVSPDLRENGLTKLRFAVENLANNFAAANRVDLVSELERAAPDIAGRSNVFPSLLVQALGTQLIGEAGAPGAWQNSDGTHIDLYKRYKEMANRARQTGFPELYIAFELVVRFMGDNPEAEIRELADDIEDLNDLDREAFISVFSSGASSGFAIEQTVNSQRVAQRFNEFLSAFGDANPVLEFIRDSLESEAKVRNL